MGLESSAAMSTTDKKRKYENSDLALRLGRSSQKSAYKATFSEGSHFGRRSGFHSYEYLYGNQACINLMRCTWLWQHLQSVRHHLWRTTACRAVR
jgi:hypothetical protein